MDVLIIILSWGNKKHFFFYQGHARKMLTHILDNEPHFWERKPIHYGSIFDENIRLKYTYFNEQFYKQGNEQFKIASNFVLYVRSLAPS